MNEKTRNETLVSSIPGHSEAGIDGWQMNNMFLLNIYSPDFIIASPKSEIQPVIGINEIGYSPLLLCEA